jgi:hypothetical protein
MFTLLYRREREGLLHKFEWADTEGNNSEASSYTYEPEAPTAQFRQLNLSGRQGSSHMSSNARQKRFESRDQRVNRKADVLKVVKEFSRSAAGMDKTLVEDLRPPEVLQRTVAYLCTKYEWSHLQIRMNITTLPTLTTSISILF